MAMAWLPVGAAAQTTATPRVTITRGTDTVTVAARTERVSVRQTLTSTSFALTASDGRDAVNISGNTEGQIVVRRGGHALAISMRDATAPQVEAVRALLRESPALARLGELATSAWGRSHKGALVFVSAHAMASLLQGQVGPLKTMAQRFEREGQPAIRPVQMTASMCWKAYQKDVLDYTYELEACIQESSASLNPLRSAWCAYSYNLKATLAFVWLMDCSGY